MKLNDIFAKPVNRQIEGVIKADDEASLKLEIEEYILTNEVSKRLELFLDAYNNYAGANGVWISGFFGSGKSHLLKMLALVLENRQIDGSHALDLFLPKCQDNEILRGDLKRAVAIPSRSILFNIDQKADVISKTELDALLAVFVKVFDDMCGYYGKQGHIAQFERELDSRGMYSGFKTAFKAVSGLEWDKGREQALLEADNIAKAYAEATGGSESSAHGILDKYRSQYRVSIEDFAENVNAYIETQAEGFRLNFFVDEVGQYIAENTKLMTNLQTISESLATKCRGRAWLIVTAQEDLDSVFGEKGKQQSSDFSKIQDRFKNRMKLTSTDVAEVIQKRLLLKNEVGINLLTSIYHDQVNNFRTMFDFGDNSVKFNNFSDRDHFIHCYPFIPYQFDLFQSSIQSLSNHNAFEGKHSSVGERSMLGVFQQVGIEISQQEHGKLASFDLMFEGIRTAMKAGIQSSVQLAERNLGNPFAVRVLKALFLVKYVKGFKATIRNLCILMQEDFAQDLEQLHKDLEAALELLAQQSYIQRTGEAYEYLTDEEKDVEQEIKATEVEFSEVAKELATLVFERTIKSAKIRHLNGQDYAYTRKLDDKLVGSRDFELTIDVISPLNDKAGEDDFWLMQSMLPCRLLVVMPADARFVSDLRLYKQTDKYVRHNGSSTQQENIRRILEGKAQLNKDRYAELEHGVKALLAKASLMVGGKILDINSTEPLTRVTLAFQDLIKSTYIYLDMLRGINYSEGDLHKYLQNKQASLLEGEAAALSEAEQELLNWIKRNNSTGVRSTLKALDEDFEKKPYGWPYAAILCNVAKLFARGKLEARLDSNSLEGSALESVLKNTHQHANLILEPQVDFSPAQVRALKDFYGQMFDAPPKSSEARELGKETAAAFADLLASLDQLSATHVPFLSLLPPVIAQLRSCCAKPSAWYVTELPKTADELLDAKEVLIEPLLKFMAGPQFEIYQQACRFMDTQRPNFECLDAGRIAEFENILSDPYCFKSNAMQQLKSFMQDFAALIETQLEHERKAALEMVEELKSRLMALDVYAKLSVDKTQVINQIFDRVRAEIEQQILIGLIRDRLNRFRDKDYSQLLNDIDTWVQPPVSIAAEPGAKSMQLKPAAPPIVNARNLKVSYAKACLENPADVDDYLEKLRAALMEQIQAGKRIQI